ncbi:MAG: DUF3168 domain-containing protein [Parvibaculaceae bacterium]
MASPTLELQGAIVALLKAHEPLKALVGTRIHDQVPRDPRSGATTAEFPYASMGPSFELQDDADCIRSVEVSFQIDAWSRAQGFPEVLRIADEVRSALHQQEFDLSTNALVSFDHRRTDKLRDSDGVTSHAVIVFIALIEQP